MWFVLLSLYYHFIVENKTNKIKIYYCSLIKSSQSAKGFEIFENLKPIISTENEHKHNILSAYIKANWTQLLRINNDIYK